MKLRTGFVSNSSSSSFIISRPKDSKASMTVEIDLEDFCNDIITTMQELDDYFLSEYSYKTISGMLTDDEHCKKLYNKCWASIQDGNEVMIGRVSSDGGDVLSNLIYDTGITNLNDGVKLIDNII